MSSLGKAIKNSKQKSFKNGRQKYREIVEMEREVLVNADANRKAQPNKLKSIWETNDLENFLSIADEREEGYNAERDVRLVIGGKVHIVGKDYVVPHVEDVNKDWVKLSEKLTIPKRPEWDFKTSPEELQMKEKEGFLTWRRELAAMEEENKVLMTPYEKNLEVWRQLWRVVERADVVVLILDARNPLVFRCRDFELYVQSMKTENGNPKKVIFLLNKADLLTEEQRKEWAEYFLSNNDIFFFFSAKPREPEPAANEDVEEEPSEMDSAAQPADDGKGKGTDGGKTKKSRHKKKTLREPVEVMNAYELADRRKQLKEKLSEPKSKPQIPLTEEEIARDERVESAGEIQPWSLLDAVQLLDQFALLRKGMGITDKDTPIMVGLVGFPNVGKSSTINAILGAKKVVVSATPGKTKHFQTLTIPYERRVELCDCPGLVFPSFASTKEHMVADGILPIDNATDVLKACEVIGRRVPRHLLEIFLNISLLPEDDIDESDSLAERLLNQLSRRRGYLASHDRPNRARAGKELLKMYLDGFFVYVEPPPSYNPSKEMLMLPSAGALDKSNGGKKTNDDEEDEEYEDWDSEEEDAWADLNAADDERALSEGDRQSEDSYIYDDNPPLFYIRPRGLRSCYTRQELFNAVSNEAQAENRKINRRKKKKINQQLEPDMYTFINRQGEVELRLDDDDGVIELVKDPTGPARPTLPREKKTTKRKERREMKKMGMGPVNPSTKRVGIHDYQQGL